MHDKRMIVEDAAAEIMIDSYNSHADSKADNDSGQLEKIIHQEDEKEKEKEKKEEGERMKTKYEFSTEQREQRNDKIYEVDTLVIGCDTISESMEKNYEEIDDYDLICSNEQLNDKLEDRVATDENAIVNMNHFWKELHEAFDHHDKTLSCAFENLKFIKTRVVGLKTLFVFKCDMCSVEEVISNVPDEENDLQLDDAAVIGCHTIGIGLSQLQELLSICGIRPPKFKCWQKHELRTIECIKEAAEKTMIEAAAEEGRLAIERGDVIDGIPFITVEADGSYMKRSYVNGKYDSPSCCVIIIGKCTKKIIQIVVKQKTCAICDYAENYGNPKREHNCYRTHGRGESSTSMESSAMAEAFANSVKDRKLIYNILVSDGDSTNYKAILDRNPYSAYGIVVKNILCANHIRRNVSTSIKALSKKRGFLGPIRKTIEESAPKFLKAIDECIAVISKEDTSIAAKNRSLRENIQALPPHIFGYHEYCHNYKYACNKKKETNNYAKIVENNLLEEINACVYRAVRNTQSLLQNWTTNTVESANALIAKAIGGKRIHLAKRGSYGSRCHIAVISHNTGVTLSPICESMGKKVPSVGDALQKKRLHLNITRKARNAENETRMKRKRKHYPKADKYYGPYAATVDLSREEYGQLIENHYKTLDDWIKDKNNIEQRTRDQSNNDEWKNKRKWLITGSKMGLICKRRPHTSCASIVKGILYPKMQRNDNPAMSYGLAMEIVIKSALKDIGYKLIDCGLIVDDEVRGIGATPDALIDNNGVLEIKSSYKGRDMEAIDTMKNADTSYISSAIAFKNDVATLKTNHNFYYQIQGQLHVTKRDYGLLVIATSKSFQIVKVMRNQSFITNMLEKLKQFYEDCLLPEILDSRKYKNLPIREPDYILQAQDEQRKRTQMQEREKKENARPRIKRIEILKPASVEDH